MRRTLIGLPLFGIVVIAVALQWASIGQVFYQLGTKLWKFWGYGSTVFIAHSLDSVVLFFGLTAVSIPMAITSAKLLTVSYPNLARVGRMCAFALGAGGLLWAFLLLSPFLQLRS